MFYLSSFDYEPAWATSVIKYEAVILTEWITVVFFSIIIFSNLLCVVSNLFWPLNYRPILLVFLSLIFLHAVEQACGALSLFAQYGLGTGRQSVVHGYSAGGGWPLAA